MKLFIFKYKLLSLLYSLYELSCITQSYREEPLLFCRQKVYTTFSPHTNLCNLLGAQAANGLGREKVLHTMFSLTDNHTICLRRYQVWIFPFGEERKEPLMLWPNHLRARTHTKTACFSCHKNLRIPWAR